MKHIFFAALCLVFAASAIADPQLTSWLTAHSGQYARVFETTTAEGKSQSVTTWTNQSLPAYADIADVYSSANWVYIRYPDLASYTMGPWLTPNGEVFQFWPVNQHGLAKFPRHPAVQNGTKTITGTGYSGNYVNGMAIFNALDGKAWDGSELVMGPHNKPTYYWHRNAPVGESFNYDAGLGHQNPSGVYHTHQNPIALRYQLGDHVDYNSSTHGYAEDTNVPTQHSPILGWSYDGYPIYGPYGYSSAMDTNSGIRRMVSGYVVRDGNNGTDEVATNLGVLPAWYARFRQAHFGGSYSTAAGTNRPAVDSTYPLGTFAEDYSYLGDLTNPATGSAYQQGTDFDLDEYNGRYCVTPEFPTGTYAYFVDIDSNGTGIYPYVFGFEYYGAATGSNGLTSITEPVTTNFVGGADTPLTVNTPNLNTTNDTVTLEWSSVEGGTYVVDSSTNDSTWVNENTNVPSQGISTTTNYVNSTTHGTDYARVTRTALASYDDAGGGSGVVNQSAIASYLAGNDPPEVENPIPNQTATYGNSFSFTFASDTFTDVDAGQTLSYAATSAVLANTGISFNGATRTFSAAPIDAINGGTITGAYTVQVVATDNGTPPLSATNTFTLTINKAPASVTPVSWSRVYGGNNPVFGGTLIGFLAADSITAGYSCGATTNSPVGAYPIVAALSDPDEDSGNYAIATNTGTLTITQAVITVTADNFWRAYGSANPPFTVSYAGFTNGQTLATSGISGAPALIASAMTNSPIGTYTITNSIGSLAAVNYNFDLVNGALTVTQASMTVAAANANRTYGATNPVFTGTISGLVNNDNITATYTCSATTNSPAGGYPIVPALTDPQGRLANYSVTTNNGTLTVSKASLMVVADSKTRGYGAANPAFTVSYTGFKNGETSSSGTISGSPALATSAETNSSVGEYTITNSLGSLASADYSFTLSNGVLTVTQVWMTVTPADVSRAYGQANPLLTGAISGIVNADDITAAYSTRATPASPVGSYPITATLNDPDSKLMNYLVTTNQGTLTVTNAAGLANSTVSLLVSNSLVSVATNGTVNDTFTDPNSGLSVVIAVTMTPYSSSNASPVFTLLDTYGINNSPIHLGINSGLGGGDGNWVDDFEGVNFMASLVSASPGILTNSIEFGVAGLGIRPSQGNEIWTSSTSSNSILPDADAIYPLDTNLASLAGQSYWAKLRSLPGGQYQLSDYVNPDQLGLILEASFFEGQIAVPTVAAFTLTNNEFKFTINGTPGADYIVEATTNLAPANWIPVQTNPAPFTFTESNATTFGQRFYRIIAQ